jgi:uncharacterized membrane protein YfcA
VSVQALVLLTLLGVAVGTFGTLVGSIDYCSGVAFAAATLPGSVAGVLVVGIAPRRLFDALTGALLAGVAVFLIRGRRASTHPRANMRGSRRMLTDREGRTYEYTVNMRSGVLFSVAVGFVSSFLGIGGGILHVPIMVTALGFPVHVATATSHFVLANMAAVGSITHIATGASSNGVGVRRALALSVGVVGGAQLGAWFSTRIRGPVIQRMLAVAPAALAFRLLIGAL